MKLIIIILLLFSNISFASELDSIQLKKCDYAELLILCNEKNPFYLHINSYESDSLPTEIGKLTNLEYLYINFGKFNTIPKSIGKLIQLKELTISNGRNELTIPPEIGELTNLIELNLFNYKIKSLPNEIGNLLKLEKVMLCGELNSIPNSIQNWKNIEHLYLAGNQFTQIPSFVYNFKNLEYLDLSNSNISFISDSIKHLQNLTDFELSGNIELTTLPKTICELYNLEELNVKNTMIASIPFCLSKNSKLKRIQLCKTLIMDEHKIETVFGNKIQWSWRCRYLQSKLIDFTEIYGQYDSKLTRIKDTVVLTSNYFYNEPNVIDEEFWEVISIKIQTIDSIETNKIYNINNPLFISETSSYSIWDWSNKHGNNLNGHILFKEISNEMIIAYLNLDLIKNNKSSKLINKLIEFKK